MLHTLIQRLRFLRRRAQLHQDLDDELQAHLALKQQRLELQGLPPEEARRRARLSFGGATLWKERLAGQWTFPSLESLWRDLAFGARMLLKDKVFTAVALVTLTLGVGANTAVFSLLNGMLWRSLPVREPEQLVRVRVVNLPPTDRAWVNGRAVKPKERSRLPFGLASVLQRQDLFQGVFGQAGARPFVADVAGEMHRLNASVVTGSYFPVLGVEPAAGRLLSPSDDVPGGPPTGWHIVLSDRAWDRLFQRRADAIGARIVLERISFTIVGVAPRGFQSVNPGYEPDLWLPVSVFESMFPKWHWRSDPDVWMLETMARLRPGLDIERARERLRAMSASLLREVEPPGLGGEHEAHYLAMKLDLRPAASGYSYLTEAYGPALWTLMAAVAATLLIAAANLTSLILARSTARQREIAVRLALGASANRVRRQLLIESALLAALGAVGGVLCSRWLAVVLLRAASQDDPIQLDAPLDWNVLAFAAALLSAVVLVAGCLPAWSAVRGAIAERARRRVSTRLRGGLVVAQFAFTLALLGAAGLLLASLRSTFREATGFDAAHTLFITPDLLNAGVGPERILPTYADILDETRRLPHVRAAAWTMHVPLTGGLQAFTIELPSRPDVRLRDRMVFAHQVTDGYFSAAGVPLIAGHDFPPRGASAPKGSIVSRNLAVKFFGSPEAALGQRLKPGSLDWTEIIGVAADAKFQDVREPNPLTVYTSYWEQQTTLGMTLVINHTGRADPIVKAVSDLSRRQSSRAPFVTVKTVAGNLTAALAVERLLTGLLTAFAAFALLISAIGVVGLLSYTVQLKRRDIGLRIALGATPAAIAAEVERQGLRLAALGLALGAILSWWLRRLIQAQLFRVQADDPLVWFSVCALLAVCALAASAIPAWRAARLDPLSVLRTD